MVTRRTYPLAPRDRELAEGIGYALRHDPLAGKESVDVDVCGARATPADAVALVLRIDRIRSRRHHRMLRALLRLPDGNGRDDPFGLHLRPVTDALILDWQGSRHLMEINARDGETGHASGDA